MKRILAATDFSTRSDRALRRATLLAQAVGAELVLAHVVDSDGSPETLDDQRREAEVILEDLAATVRETDRVSCRAIVLSGEAPEQIAALAAETGADAIVVGPPRRNAVRNLLVGATAARSARAGGAPVILAAGVPRGGYRQILIATDLSDASATAARAARDLGMLNGVRTAAVHAYEAPGQGLLLRANLTQAQFRAYLLEEGAKARGELAEFLNAANLSANEQIVELIESTPAAAIRSVASRIRADLLVVGARGRSAVESLLLGSVTTELVAASDIDLFIASGG
ncbi:MAG: universal stress protein [Phenylobacterium sp.]|uniref:universal stress protein n=1 Tax=Phenylobacterium sp. TaxID=1871053 RepID=UPI00391BD091